MLFRSLILENKPSNLFFIFFIFALTLLISLNQELILPLENSFFTLKINVSYHTVLVVFLLLVAYAILIFFNLTKNLVENVGIFFSVFIYLIFMNFILPLGINLEAIFYTIILLFIIKILHNIYEKPQIEKEITFIGLLISLISILNIHNIFLLLLVVLFFLLIQNHLLKNIILLIISFLIPILMIESINFFLNTAFLFPSFKHNTFNQFINTANISIFILLFLSIFLYYRIFKNKITIKKIKHRKYFLWYNFAILILWVTFLITNDFVFLYYLLPFLAIAMLFVFINLSKTIYLECFIFTFIVLNILLLLF